MQLNLTDTVKQLDGETDMMEVVVDYSKPQIGDEVATMRKPITIRSVILTALSFNDPTVSGEERVRRTLLAEEAFKTDNMEFDEATVELLKTLVEKTQPHPFIFTHMIRLLQS